LVDLFERTMMHGRTNPKFKNKKEIMVLGSAGSGQDNTVVRFCENSDEISCNISVVSGARAAWSV